MEYWKHFGISEEYQIIYSIFEENYSDLFSVYVVSSSEPRHFHAVFKDVLKFPDTEKCYLISSINNTINAFLLVFI